MKEERITIEPKDKELGLEIMEFMKDIEDIMDAAKKVSQPYYKFDPSMFLMWRLNENRRKA